MEDNMERLVRIDIEDRARTQAFMRALHDRLVDQSEPPVKFAINYLAVCDSIAGYELNAEERGEFDYLDWDAIDNGEDSHSFVRYQGQLYDLGEFMAVWGIMDTRDTWPAWLRGWDGYMSDSYFSGVLIRYSEDLESVLVATFIT